MLDPRPGGACWKKYFPPGRKNFLLHIAYISQEWYIEVSTEKHPKGAVTVKQRAVGYVRVSTEEQAREGVSLEAQESKIRAYAELHDLDLVAVVRDEGLSGKNLRRPGVQAVLDAVKSGEVEHVIVSRLDRLTRSVRNLLEIVEDVLKPAGVQFHSLSETIDTSTPQGGFFLTLMGAMAQMEREMIGERVREALAYKLEVGEYLGAAPLGFEAVETPEGRKLAEVETEQQAVSRARELRAQGFTLRQVAEVLTREGYQTKRGGQWYACTVQKVLSREIGLEVVAA